MFLMREQPPFSLLRLFDYGQRHLSLNIKRGLLALFLLLQAIFIGGYLALERARIEDDVVRVLRNTALLASQNFETSMDAMRFQLRGIGSALLLNHIVAPQASQGYLLQELKKDWLDAVIVTNPDGDFVAKSSLFPFEQALDSSILGRATFRDRPQFSGLTRDDANERLRFWRGDGTDPNFRGFFIYSSVRDSLGQNLGGVIGFLNSASLQRQFADLEKRGLYLGPGGVVVVVDRDSGQLLARIGTPASDTPSAQHLMGYASDTALQAHHYVSPFDGVNRLGVFLNINGHRWVVLVAAAEHDYLRGWYLRTVLATAAFAVMAVLQWMLLHYAHANFVQRERLARQARFDPLTDLANRRHFDEWARGACNLARRQGQPLSVLSFDLDRFKNINDTYGHDAGDVVLQRVSQTVRGMLRDGDIVARFGGEEFVVALPQTALDEAAQIAERIRVAFGAQEVKFNGQIIRFTASFGVAQTTPGELEASDGIHAAVTRSDQALYQSKQAGRDRVTVAQ